MYPLKASNNFFFLHLQQILYQTSVAGQFYAMKVIYCFPLLNLFVFFFSFPRLVDVVLLKYDTHRA